MIFPSWYQHQSQERKAQRRRPSNWLPLKRQPLLEMKIILILYCHPESIPRAVSYGLDMSHLHQPLESMLLTYKMNLTRDYRQDKLERQVSAQLEKNSTHNASMSWSVRLLFNALREVSYWCVSVMKLKWQSKPTKLYMKVRLPMACVKHSWLNKRKMKCKPLSSN